MIATISEPLLGFVELDAEGQVLYFNPERRGEMGRAKPHIVGLNFFTDVVKFDDTREFRERINSFVEGHAPAQSFNFTFHLGDGSYPVRVLLARIHDRTFEGRGDSLFVHMRKA